MASGHENAGNRLQLLADSGLGGHADAVLPSLRTPSLRYSNHRSGAASAGHSRTGGTTTLALDRGDSTPPIGDANPVLRVWRVKRGRVGGEDGRRHAG